MTLAEAGVELPRQWPCRCEERASDAGEDSEEAWLELTKSAMGVPRTIGGVLTQAWYRANSVGRLGCVLRAVDGAEIFATTTLDTRLDETLRPLVYDIDGLDHHAFATGSRQLFPPCLASLDRNWIEDADDL